jgi:hypothetical protein
MKRINRFYFEFFSRESESIQRSQTDDDLLSVHEEIRNL